MNTKEKVEELRKRGYDYHTAYHKLGLTRDERINYEREIRKEMIQTKYTISYLEFGFALLSIVSIVYLSLKNG